MVDGDVFRMSEAADTAESAAVRFARKQTNKGRAAEEIAMSAATLTLPSEVLPMLLLMMTRRLPSLQIADETDGDMDQVHGVRTQMALF